MPSCAPKQCLLVGAQHCWLFLYHRLLYPARHLCPSQGQSSPLHLLHPSHLTPVPAASALIVGLSEVSQGSTLSAAGPHTGPSRQTTVILRDLFFIRVCRLALGERECGESETGSSTLNQSHLQPARLSTATEGSAWLLLETSPVPPFREPTPSPMRLGFMSSPLYVSLAFSLVQ